MEFGRLGGTFTMHGEIEPGDSIAFVKDLISWDYPPTIFHIESPGGDLAEAMQIGRIIRDSHVPVWTGEECSSACVFIYVSGVERLARGRVGLHRPYFGPQYFSGLTSAQAKKKYADLRRAVEGFLKEMEVSNVIKQRIFETGSNEMDFISESESNRIFGEISPFYDEWLAAKCGRLSPHEQKVIDSWANLVAARSVLTIAADDTIPKSEAFGSNFSELMEASLLAFRMEQAGTLQPFKDTSKRHSECRESAAEKHIYSFHRALKKYMSGEDSDLQ
tara:strand:+ start:867 stop:1694 length:828 start_codon:yes stop_codon:yes gene_type:complete